MRDVTYPWDAEGRAVGAAGGAPLAERLKSSTVVADVIRNPFADTVATLAAPEGASLVEMIEAAFPEALRRYVVAHVDGVEVPHSQWRETRPVAGAKVALMMRPGDGVSDFLRTILQIAVIAVSVWVGGLPALGAWAPFAAAGVTIAGNLLINALVPLEPGRYATERPADYWTITGARNQARTGEPFPLVFGAHRFTPPVWGLPIQEVDGDNVYLRYVFCLGPGPLEVSDVKIGETPIEEFDDIDLEWRLTADDPPHTLYTGDPSAEAIGADINTDWDSRTTAANVDEIEVVIAFPQGLGAFDDKNRKQSRSVGINVEYRLAGQTPEAAWQNLLPTVQQANVAAAAAGMPWRPGIVGALLNDVYYTNLEEQISVPSGAQSFMRADPGRPYQDKIRWAVPRGQYDVRVKRTTAASEDTRIFDACQWVYLKGRDTTVDPFPVRECASLAVRIKASGELNGIVDTVNMIVKRLAPAWSIGALGDPSTATAASLSGAVFTRDPASLALWAQRGPHVATPKPDDEIDWPAWAAFAKWCFDQNLHYDDVIDRKITRDELTRRICSAGFGRPVRKYGKLSVVIDRPQPHMPSLVFTPRNVRNFRWEKSFPPPIHALRVPYADAAKGYASEELVHYLPGYGEADVYEGETLVTEGASRFESLSVPGKVDAEELERVVAQYARNAMLQTQRFMFEMDVESLTVTLGAYVLIQHDAMAAGIGAARIKSVETNESDEVVALLLDADVETPDEILLEARWRITRDGPGNGDSGPGFETGGGVYVERDPANPRRFVLGVAFDPEDAPKIGWPVLIGEVSRIAVPALVRAIEPDENEGATITCVEYAPTRFNPEDLVPEPPVLGLPD